MNNDLISREALLNEFNDKCQRICPTCEHHKWHTELNRYECELINTAPTVYITETEIQEVLNKRCMTAVANEYLIALQNNRATAEWIPVNKKLPDDLETVNITYINHEPEQYYKEIKDKPFTAPSVYFNGQWYWWSSTCKDILAEYSNNFDDVIDRAIEVIAWQPLPEPYKKAVQNDNQF